MPPFLIKFFTAFIFVFTTTLSGICQVQEYFVKPNQTDTNYASQDSHFVAYNTAAPLNKLLLFIGGTFSSAKQYDYFCRYAAGLGFNAISLTYPNSVLTTLLAGSSDSLAFNKFRQEICFGTQVSSFVSVDSFNSIYTRTVKLIQYLSTTYPSQNWNQYLATSETLDWNKIVVSGHSQGSGHACYFAKLFSVERAVMFSGPNDYSTYFSNSAPWLRQPGVTPVNKHFVFLHLQDEVVPFNRQYANITGLGMLQVDDTTLVEENVPPYFNSRCLYTKLPPGISGSYHNSTVIYSSTPVDVNGTPLFSPVWDYMLLTPFTTGIINLKSPEPDFYIYPNPATSFITFDLADKVNNEIFVFNSCGKVMFSENVRQGKMQFDISVLPAGIYFVLSNGKVVPFMKY